MMSEPFTRAMRRMRHGSKRLKGVVRTLLGLPSISPLFLRGASDVCFPALQREAPSASWRSKSDGIETLSGHSSQWGLVQRGSSSASLSHTHRHSVTPQTEPVLCYVLVFFAALGLWPKAPPSTQQLITALAVGVVGGHLVFFVASSKEGRRRWGQVPVAH